MEEALALLAQPDTLPLGGGTLLSKASAEEFAVVDLQSLGLDGVQVNGHELQIGATCTLQALYQAPDCPAGLKQALKLEAPLNLRNSATVAGSLAASDGRSPFVTGLLALDAKVNFAGGKALGIGEYLLTKPKGLITSVVIPLHTRFGFEYVAKTPMDKPLVCAAVSQWQSGRTRLALGGYGKSPLLAMDGTGAEGIESAARNAYHEAQDEWASAAYRMDVAATLALRCLAG